MTKKTRGFNLLIKNSFILTLFFFFLAIMPNCSIAQRIRIGGIITVDGNTKLEKCTVSLLLGGDVIEEKITDLSGRFVFNLKPKVEYYITASKKGYVTKKLYVSTNDIPENVDIIWTSGISIDLFKEVRGLDVSILDSPVGRIYYYEEFKNLSYDVLYTKKISAQLEVLQEALIKHKESEKIRLKEEQIQNTKKKIADAKEQRKMEDQKRINALKAIAEEKRKNAINKNNNSAIKGQGNSKNGENSKTQNDSLTKRREELAKENFNKKLTNEEKEKYMSELVKNTTIGTTVEIERYENFTITRIVYNNGKVANEYKMIEFNFGNYYKKDFIDITEEVFKSETKGYEQFIKK